MPKILLKPSSPGNIVFLQTDTLQNTGDATQYPQQRDE